RIGGEQGRRVVLPRAEGRGPRDKRARGLLARREGRMRREAMPLINLRRRGPARDTPRRLVALALVVFVSLSALAQTPAPKVAVPAQWRAALEQVSADDMRGHLSFIASDALEGRKTPSRGLDIAAEYIAAQFRRAGLEPAGDDGYFQTANWSMTGRDISSTRVTISKGGSDGGSDGGETLNVRPEQL